MGRRYELSAFKDDDGNCEYERFREGLDARAKAKALYLEEVLREHGTALRFPLAKAVDGPIWELRGTGEGAVRIYYWRSGSKAFVIACGEQKFQDDANPRLIQFAKDCHAKWKAKQDQQQQRQASQTVARRRRKRR